jgi:hypothetical protein
MIRVMPGGPGAASLAAAAGPPAASDSVTQPGPGSGWLAALGPSRPGPESRATDGTRVARPAGVPPVTLVTVNRSRRTPRYEPASERPPTRTRRWRPGPGGLTVRLAGLGPGPGPGTWDVPRPARSLHNLPVTVATVLSPALCTE